MELQVWPGDWGLPSVDQHCLAAMVYCKFSKATVDIKHCSNPWRSPSGQFPVLRHLDGFESKVTDIFRYLQTSHVNVDQHLTAVQRADCLAFSALLEEKLLPAVLHLWWVDSKNYVEFTRPWYAKTLPFPLSMYLPLKKRNACIAQLHACHGSDFLTDAEREAKLIGDAKGCLNLLSAKLAEKKYFFGDSPSTLDALVFGNLAPLLMVPLPNSVLQNHLKGCKNLSHFCTRILEDYFPISPQEKEALRKAEEEARQRLAEVSEYPHRKRNLILGGIVGVTAMIGYALLTGLIKINFDSSEKNSDTVDGKSEKNIRRSSED